ncbi:hypothetical protein [Azospirillum agricola]|uniref:hypothetical protein n=1 Tax=Azospirillum agricola TaxID=1720247 RepID=UPI0011774CB4|nr:hypothetical protein [Azospirillum agricola]
MKRKDWDQGHHQALPPAAFGQGRAPKKPETPGWPQPALAAGPRTIQPCNRNSAPAHQPPGIGARPPAAGHRPFRPGVVQAMEVLNPVSLEQRQVIEQGNIPQEAYQASEKQIMDLRNVVQKWNGSVPSVATFKNDTSVFFELSYTLAFGQIINNLAFFHAARTQEEKIIRANHLILSCNYWLRKANVKTKDSKPLDYVNNGQLPKGGLKLKGAESRRVPILALSVLLSNWLTGQGKTATISSIIDSMTIPNQGMTPDHGSKDVIWWNRFAGNRVPETIKTKELRNEGSFDDIDERLVSLDNDSQKRIAKLIFRAGVAYKWGNNDFGRIDDVGYALFNTSSSGVHFVMDRRGRIYAGTLSNVFFVHSSLVGFADALSAGFIVAKQGRITGIKNDSGHYKPGAEEMVKALQRLELYGVNLSGVSVERLQATHRLGGRVFSAAEILNAPSGKWPDEEG